MKILVSAIACRPGAGSEWHVGWTSVSALARKHELVVLTHGFNRQDIEAGLMDHPHREHLQFHFLGEPIKWSENRMIARMQDWLDYRQWCTEARKLAQQLIAQQPFELAHHVTFASWRMPSPLAGLGLPMVFGPVGGGEVFPRKFFGILSKSSKLFELARMLSNQLAVRTPGLRRAMKSDAVLLPNNRETAAVMRQAGAREEQLMIATQSFVTPRKIQEFDSYRSARQPYQGGEIRIFAGGNLEGRKGVAIAIKALARLKADGIPFRFLYGGYGPERDYLVKLAGQLGLSEQVRFESMLQKQEYMQELHHSHIYLLPSLREGCPITLLEAMLAGCVPVVANCGGQAIAVQKECGILVEPKDPKFLEQEIANALRNFHQHPEQWNELSSAAIERVKSGYSEAGYLAAMEKAYQLAIDINSQHSTVNV